MARASLGVTCWFRVSESHRRIVSASGSSPSLISTSTPDGSTSILWLHQLVPSTSNAWSLHHGWCRTSVRGRGHRAPP